MNSILYKTNGEYRSEIIWEQGILHHIAST